MCRLSISRCRLLNPSCIEKCYKIKLMNTKKAFIIWGITYTRSRHFYMRYPKYSLNGSNYQNPTLQPNQRLPIA